MRRSIQALSQTWQHEFRQAVTTCNLTASRPLVERIRDQNPALAHHLMTLVKHFQFDLLQNLLEDAKSGEDTSLIISRAPTPQPTIRTVRLPCFLCDPTLLKT